MARKCPHCGTVHPPKTKRCPTTGLPMGGDPRLVGRTIAGRYHLVRMLGDGGMGAVYKAADPVLRRFVAVKMLHRSVVSRPAAVERFRREARAAASIGHPNIIEVLDFGEEDNAPFLVMEYVRGRSLAHVIHSDGTLDVERACNIATHALAGLSAAHNAGVLHRDLKPANLLLGFHLGDKDFVKICDFGFAALLRPRPHIADSNIELTPTHTLVGTPAYAAPERLRGDDRRDPRTDVYSMGVVMFEMLAGQRPFDAPNIVELARMVRDQQPPALRSFRSDVPSALEQVVGRALAKTPEERWPSATAMAEALVPFGGRLIPDEEDHHSDTFAMELQEIRARGRRRTPPPPPPPERIAVNIPQPAAVPFADETHREHFARPEQPILVPPEQRKKARAAEPTVRTRPSKRSGSGSTADESRPSGAPSPAPARAAAPQSNTPPGHAAVASPRRKQPDDSAYDGSVVVSILQFVAHRFGERKLQLLLEGLPAQHKPVFAGGITAGSWVPYENVCGLVEQIDAQLADGDLHLIVDCGRAAAEAAFERIRNLKPPHGPPPELMLSELPRLARQLLRGVRYDVKHVGKGYGRLGLTEPGTPSLAGCVTALGFLDRNVERFGGVDVEVNLLTCRALDDAECLFDISWLT